MLTYTDHIMRESEYVGGVQCMRCSKGIGEGDTYVKVFTGAIDVGGSVGFCDIVDIICSQHDSELAIETGLV